MYFEVFYYLFFLYFYYILLIYLYSIINKVIGTPLRFQLPKLHENLRAGCLRVLYYKEEKSETLDSLCKPRDKNTNTLRVSRNADGSCLFYSSVVCVSACLSFSVCRKQQLGKWRYGWKQGQNPKQRARLLTSKPSPLLNTLLHLNLR